jgi:tetratricopeptide (TPR) repeat protein
LGNIYNATGDWKNALLNYEEYNRLKKEIVGSSPENLSYKNGLAISYLKLAGVFMANEQISEAIQNYDLCRQMFFEIVQATQGQIVEFVYNFAWTCNTLTNIVKQHALFEVIEKEALQTMRQEGYAALQPLAEAGKLQERQKGLLKALSDETWYDF